MKKRILSIILAVMLLFSSIPFTVVPISAVILTGSCGDNIRWYFNDEGTLTISGSGSMADYKYSYKSDSPHPPWYSFRSYIKNIVIEEGVTRIGNGAFYNCKALESIIISEGVTSIGKGALNYCESLASIIIPEGVISIGDYSFIYCRALKNISIPKSVTSIGTSAFYSCTSLEGVYYSGTSEQWESIEIGRSNNPLLNAKIIFEGKKTEVFGDADGDGEVTTKDVLYIRKALGGITELTPEIEAAADVDGDGEITTKDILRIRKYLGGLIDEL